MDRPVDFRLISAPDEDPDALYPHVPVPAAFEEQGLDFRRARDLEATAVMLTDHYEVEFGHLRNLTLGYLWKRSGGKSSGKAVYGKCVKPSGLLGHYSDCDFIIWLAADWMRDMEVTFAQVEASVFHELKHIGVDQEDRTKAVLVGHDFEAFNDELRHYGTHAEELRIAEVTFRQLSLDEMPFGVPTHA